MTGGNGTEAAAEEHVGRSAVENTSRRADACGRQRAMWPAAAAAAAATTARGARDPPRPRGPFLPKKPPEALTSDP